MTFSVNTNGSALAAIRTLNATNKLLGSTQNRINSGFKVASAKDDASTFAIAQGLRADIAGFKAVSDAISFGQATANVALSATESVSKTLEQIKGKVVSAQADNVDRNAIQNDITALSNQVDAILGAAQFNGVNLLNGTDGDLTVLASLNRADASTAPTPYNITVAAQDLTTLGLSGINVTNGTVTLSADNTLAFATGDTLSLDAGGKTYTFEFVDDPTSDPLTAAENIAVDIDPVASGGANFAALIDKLKENGFTAEYNSTGDIVISNGVGTVDSSATTVTGLTATDVAGGDRSAALTTIEGAITSVKSALASLGTSVKQLETQSDFVKALTDVLTEGVGTLVDADLAEESANLQAVQTRQQLGIQALSIANQGPSSVLALFR